jgi:hypothetical protein
MNARFVDGSWNHVWSTAALQLCCIALATALLFGLDAAGDVPKPPFSAEDMRGIERLLREQFSGTAAGEITIRVYRGPTDDTVIVQRLERRSDLDVVVETLTLKKSDGAWKIESRAK